MKKLALLVFVFALLCPVFLAQEAEPQINEDEITELIADLGDDSFQVREDAEARLVEIGEPAVPFLEEAMKSDDPEVAHRAERALEAIRNPGQPIPEPEPEPEHPGLVPLPGRELGELPEGVREMIEDLIARLRNGEMPEPPEVPGLGPDGEPGEAPELPIPFGGGASTRIEMGPDGSRTTVTLQDGTRYEKFVASDGSVEVTVTRPDGTVEEHSFESDEAFRIGEPELYEEMGRYTGGIILRFNSGGSDDEEDNGGFGLPEDIRRRLEEMEERMRREFDDLRQTLPDNIRRRLEELRERLQNRELPNELEGVDELEGEILRRLEEGAEAVPEELLRRLEELENRATEPVEPAEPAGIEELGAVLERPDETVRYQFELGPDEGAIVTAIIDPQGVLARAGLQSWDLVTELNGVTVRSPEHLAALVGALEPGEAFNIKVFRRLQELNLVGTR